jgi:hypothetical protein
MVDRLVDETGRLIDDVHDPAIIYADLAANAEEDAALRKIIASKESTDEEIRDAQRRRLRVAKEADELRLDLLASGDLTVKDTDKWLAELEKEYGKATGEAKKDIGSLIAKIKELRREGARGVNLKFKIDFGKYAGKVVPLAEGGHAAAGQPFLVGEEGPELFTPSASGDITSAGKTAAMGGGDTHYHLTVNGDIRARDESGLLAAMRRMEAVSMKPAHYG